MNATAPSAAPDTNRASGKHVLLVTASVGSGHNQAARAIAEELAVVAPDLRVTTLDTLDFTSRLFRLKYAWGYVQAVTRFPFFYGLGYRLTDRPHGVRRTLGEKRKLWAERRAARRLVAHVCDLAPDLIVHTHFLAPPILQYALRRGGFHAPQMIVATDVVPHRWWYLEDAERWFTAHPAGAKRLQRWKIPADRITVSGIPVQRKWTLPSPPREQILADFALPAEKKIVLLTGGAMFTCGPIVKLARSIANGRGDVCVAAMAGRNKKLLARLANLDETRNGRIVPLGFSDRMHELAEVASILVTKPGGIMTAEALAKGLPMVFPNPVPGQERINAEFFAAEGAGVLTGNLRHTIEEVHRLLADNDALARLAENARRLHRPARETIATEILRVLEKSGTTKKSSALNFETPDSCKHVKKS